MKGQYAAGLEDGVRVDSVFALRSKELRSARTGDAYLTVELADRSGRIPGVLFRPSAEAVSLPAGTVVRVRGVVTSWRGTRRVSIDSLAPHDEYDRRDILPEGPHGRGELLAGLRACAAGVSEPRLRDALGIVFRDGAFLEAFLACPASQSYHHAYLGGLAEHTLAVAGACERVSRQYEQIDRDLLISAAILHDVGKVDELSFDAAVEYTDAGRLLGHVILGERRVGEAARAAGLAPDRSMQLSHVVLSHHGELEWGAPKRPATLEALALHHVDNLDAKLSGFMDAARGAVQAEASWTDSFNLFRRPLWVPRPLEDDRPAPPAEDLLTSGMRV